MRRGLLALLMLLVGSPAQSAVRAWLDRDTVALGETVTLNIETDQVDAQPDFQALQGDFVLLGTSSRTQVQAGSAGSSVSALRAVALEPRRTGTITIPSLAVGSELTEPLQLTVLPAARTATPASADEDVFLEIEVDPRTPYVQQQVRYTLRLYYAVTLLEGQLDEPAAEHLEVRRLGQDRSDQRSIDGRRYNVVERHYALIPERSGPLVVPPAAFRGRAILPGRRSTWIGAGAPVAARGEAIELDVRPRPPAAPDPWLPAAELSLEDASGTLPGSIRVGEPLTLTLRLRARGLGAAQLPELSLPPIEGASVYPDQPSMRDGNEGPWLVGERERKFAIVAEQPGELHIPAVEIAWWDTDADRVRTARLDGRRIDVLPAAGAAQPSGTAADAAEADGGLPPSEAAPARWRWQLLAAVFALLWLATLAWAWSSRRQRAPAPIQAAAARAQPPAAPLKAAFAGGDLDSIATAVRRQATALGLPARSLGELAAHLEPSQREALLAIDAARYGNGNRAAALQQARAAFPRATLLVRSTAPERPQQTSPLPPLYPP